MLEVYSFDASPKADDLKEQEKVVQQNIIKNYFYFLGELVLDSSIISELNQRVTVTEDFRKGTVSEKIEIIINELYKSLKLNRLSSVFKQCYIDSTDLIEKSPDFDFISQAYRKPISSMITAKKNTKKKILKLAKLYLKVNYFQKK